MNRSIQLLLIAMCFSWYLKGMSFAEHSNKDPLKKKVKTWEDLTDDSFEDFNDFSDDRNFIFDPLCKLSESKPIQGNNSLNVQDGNGSNNDPSGKAEAWQEEVLATGKIVFYDSKISRIDAVSVENKKHYSDKNLTSVNILEGLTKEDFLNLILIEKWAHDEESYKNFKTISDASIKKLLAQPLLELKKMLNISPTSDIKGRSEQLMLSLEIARVISFNSDIFKVLLPLDPIRMEVWKNLDRTTQEIFRPYVYDTMIYMSDIKKRDHDNLDTLKNIVDKKNKKRRLSINS